MLQEDMAESEGVKIFQKVCRRCKGPFEATARHTRYCSACKEPMKAVRRRRARSRRRYQKDKSYLRRVNALRKEARARKILNTVIQCEECSTSARIRELEVDHRDGNPAHGAEANLQWLCQTCHKRKTWNQRREGIAKKVHELENELVASTPPKAESQSIVSV